MDSQEKKEEGYPKTTEITGRRIKIKSCVHDKAFQEPIANLYKEYPIQEKHGILFFKIRHKY